MTVVMFVITTIHSTVFVIKVSCLNMMIPAKWINYRKHPDSENVKKTHDLLKFIR